MPLIDSFYLFIVCVVFVAFQGVHRLDRTGIGSTSLCVEGGGALTSGYVQIPSQCLASHVFTGAWNHHDCHV